MFKIKSSILIVLTIGFLLNGCVSRDYIMNKKGEVVKSTFINQNANGAIWLSEYDYPKKGYGTIVFYRVPIYTDLHIVQSAELFANGKFVTDLKQHGFYPLHVKAGDYTFTIDEPNPEDVSEKDKQVISGKLNDGDLFYVELNSKLISSSNLSIDPPLYFTKEIKDGLDNDLSAYKKTDKRLYYEDYRLSAARESDIKGLVKLRYDKSKSNNLEIDKQTIVDGSTGVLEGMKSSVESAGGNLLSNGIQGGILMAIPSMIKGSVTSEFEDDYLEYIGTQNGYDMDYLFE